MKWSAMWRGAGLALLLLFVVGGTGARAAGTGAAAEVKTAIEHANNSFKSQTLKDSVWHLHHVINCLVGPADPAFDKSAGDPCQGQGKGVLVDIQAGMGKDAQYWDAWWSADIAKQAVKMTNLGQVHQAAHAVVLILMSAENMK